MNKFPFVLSVALALSACKAEEVKVTDITSFSARAVSEILEVNDTYLTQKIPQWYVPESCKSETVPWPYSDPVNMIIHTTTQITCTQKYWEIQYLDIWDEVPDNLYDHGLIDVTQLILITSNGVQQVLVVPSWKFDVEIWDTCSLASDYLSACR